MANIKQVCSICNAHIDGDPSAKLISYGLCQVCGKATQDVLKGKTRHVLFYNPDQPHSRVYVHLKHVDGDYIEMMREKFGYTHRKVVI